LQPPAFEKAFVALCYYGEIREVIHLFKYRRGIWLVHDLVYFLEMVYALEILASGIEVDLVVPVPMMHAKRRKRGFNQAALLAKFFAKKVGLRYQDKLLCRRQTKAPVQARLQRKERFQYAQMAYHLGQRMDLSGKTVLLVDDVMTTGATVNACATRLKQQGAKVYVLALARPLFG
jgi:ComF family protein